MTAKKSSFVHLHNHTAYSLLDGLSRLDDMFGYAASMGQPAAAMTDHGSLGGAYKAAKAAEAAGVKAIMGEEVYLAIPDPEDSDADGNPRRDPRTYNHEVLVDAEEGTDDSGASAENDEAEKGTGKKHKRYQHLTVLAENAVGWQNLVTVSNKAEDSYWYKPRASLELLGQHSEGLIILSGCLGGPVAGKILAGDDEGAERNLRMLIRNHNPEGWEPGQHESSNVFVEIMDHGIAIERPVTKKLIALAQKLGLPLVATNDAHYVRPGDHDAHSAWLCCGSKSTVANPKFKFNGSGFHLRSAEEMRELFDGQPGTEEACNNTLLIASRIAAKVLPDPVMRIPHFPLPDGYTDAAAYLYDLVKAGAEKRWGSPLPQVVKDRLRREMDIIVAKGLADYFLIVWDMIMAARNRPDSEGGPIRTGAGRGSAAGSAVSYALRIVNVDPIEHNLLFERFLDADRDGMPDIDSDFEVAGREWVIRYLENKYGSANVARIGTYGFTLSKKAVKDAARVLELHGTGDKLAKVIPNAGGGKPLPFKDLLNDTDSRGEAFRALIAADEGAKAAATLAQGFEKVIGQEGIHACGVLIADEPLATLIPLRRDRKGSGGLVTQWDGKDIDTFGLLKLDVLGLRNLDIVSDAVRQIKHLTGEVIDPDDLPIDLANPRVRKTWDLLSEGKTAGIFQMESSGMTELCTKVQPDKLADLSAVVALYRPGPLGAQMHERYALRKSGEEAVDYGIYTKDKREQDAIATVLGETYGTCLAEGQLVYSASRGLMVPIEDIEVGETVQGVDPEGNHALAQVTHWVNNGVRPTVEVSFSSGQTLRVTRDHRVLTTTGWKQAGDLTTDDAVAAPWSLLDEADSPGKAASDFEVASARLLGYLLGDGGLTQGTDIYFYNSDAHLRAEVAEVGLAAFPDSNATQYEPNKLGVGRVRLTGSTGTGGMGGSRESAMLSWLREIGLKSPRGDAGAHGTHSRDKFIPAAYLSRTDDSALALLGSLWDCDGRIGNGSTGGPHVTYKTISRRLADDVRYLLLRFGITTTLSRHPYTNPGGTNEVAFNIGVHQTERFVELIVPFMSSRQKIDAASRFRPAMRRRQFGTYVPRTDLAHIVTDARPSWKRWCINNDLPTSSLRGSQFVGSEMVKTLADLTCEDAAIRLSKSQWQRVTGIADAAATNVYDITVEGLHNFVAQGVIVHNCAYQEQLMRLGTVIAGFGPKVTNKLRSAISKKVPEQIAEIRTLFFEGAISDVDDAGDPKATYLVSTAENLWKMFEKSGDYLFNASHSYAYGQLAYVTAYLKANWPAAYGAAMLAHTEGEEQRQGMLVSLRIEGINVMAPDVNTGWISTAVDPQGNVRLGLGEIKGVKSNAEAIVAERKANGAFTGLVDLVTRVKIVGEKGEVKQMSIAIAEGLIEAGACDSFGTTRMGMFTMLAALRPVPDAIIPAHEWGIVEQSARERARIGAAISMHPMTALAGRVSAWRDPESGNDGPWTSVHDLGPVGDRKSITTVGVIASWTEKVARTGRMATVILESELGSIECIVFPRTYLEIAASDLGLPKVGQLVGVSAHKKVVKVVRHIVDDSVFNDADSDGEDSQPEMEVAEEVYEKHELIVDRIWAGDLNDEPRLATVIELRPIGRDPLLDARARGVDVVEHLLPVGMAVYDKLPIWERACGSLGISDAQLDYLDLDWSLNATVGEVSPAYIGEDGDIHVIRMSYEPEPVGSTVVSAVREIA